MTPGRTAMAGTLGRCCERIVYGRIRAAALLGALAFSSPLLADPPGDDRAYKLGPGDRINVTVFSSMAGAEAACSISVRRTRDGMATVFQATATITLQPGDIVDVKRLLPRELTYQGSSASVCDQIGAAAPERRIASASR
jgi:protein involved in polysaccharide export with SLBB domain